MADTNVIELSPIRISYHHLAMFPVDQALRTLTATKLPEKVAFSVGKMAQEVEKAMKKLRADYAELVKTFDPTWEIGNPKLSEEQKTPFKDAEDKFFDDNEAVITRAKLDFNQIKAQLTPSEMMALEPLFVNLPE